MIVTVRMAEVVRTVVARRRRSVGGDCVREVDRLPVMVGWARQVDCVAVRVTMPGMNVRKSSEVSRKGAEIYWSVSDMPTGLVA